MKNRDCAHCFYARNNSCSQLSCIGYQYVGSIDSDILSSAASNIDHSRHPQSKHGSRRFAEAEERVKQAEKLRQAGQIDQPHAKAPNNQPRNIQKGRVLWYKDKRTGDICSGEVMDVSLSRFLFRFGNRGVFLTYDVINNRLFYTKDEARRYGRTK